MTAFDWAAGGVLGVSAVVGLLRGATREVTGLMALVLAGVLALASGRLAGPLFDQLIHPAWLARPAGMAVVFVLAYVALRLIGGLLARGVRGVGLSGPDRILGLAIGMIRGVAVLGVFGLVLGAIVPADHTPGWIGRARLYPLARGAGAVIRAAAPIALAQASADHPPSPRAHALVVVEDPH